MKTTMAVKAWRPEEGPRVWVEIDAAGGALSIGRYMARDLLEVLVGHVGYSAAKYTITAEEVPLEGTEAIHRNEAATQEMVDGGKTSATR